MIRALWSSKWGVLRLAVAVFALWVVAADSGARLARLQLSALPGFDYAAEMAALRAQGRFGEAVVIADAGLEDADASHDAIRRERDATIAERDSWWRKAKAVGMGAVSGRGDSLEGLLGAVTADFFVVGDVRDLVIQGSKLAVDGEADELILALSAAGLATTLVPAADWAPAILKAGRKVGAVGEKLAGSLVSMLKRGKGVDEILPVLGDVQRLAGKASPGGAVRLLRHADEPADIARMARFVEREPRGAFALLVGGERGAKTIKAAEGGTDAAFASEKLLLKCARKGRAGVEFLGSAGGKRLLKPHPLLGLAKAIWKGNAQKLIERLVDRIDPLAWWLLPALAAWAFVEGAVIVRRFAAPSRSPRPA